MDPPPDSRTPPPSPPVAPRLRAGLAVFALDDGRVRIGLANPVVLDGLTADEAAYVASLEGPPRLSTTHAPFAHVLQRLERLGVLSQADPSRVSQNSVCVIGADALGTAVALCLAQAGLHDVVVDDNTPVAVTAVTSAASATKAQAAVRTINGRVPHTARVAAHAGTFASCDVTVVVANGGPSVDVIHDLMAADRPHLPVITDERGITVGPLVVPGRGPCLMCLGIERTDADPDWPLVALQCNGARAPHAPAAVSAIAAGVACDAVVRFLRGYALDPRQWRVECVAPGRTMTAPGRTMTAPANTVVTPATSLRGGPSVTERTVSAHAACGCADPLVLGDDLENLQTILF